MSVRIITGDCRAELAKLPDQSVHCCVTSPPYWGLRDYGVDGQLGMEQCLADHVQVMTEVFREVRRVLRNDGTLWLNYGDSYASSVNGRSAADVKVLGNDDRTFRDKPFSTIGPISRPGCSRMDANAPLAAHRHRNGLAGFDVDYLKPKDLCGIPWRVAFALQADGWYLRQDIIWAKPNPMPESVTDRCTKAHEYIFLLSKNARYFYDADAIKEPASYDPNDTKFPDGWDTGPGGHGTIHRNGREKGRASGNKTHRTKAGLLKISETAYPMRNKRSVWEVATQPFSDAHFATFPPALIEPCIKAGCPEGGTVLDPFGGAGTTGLVADRLKRNAILIELNPAYVAMAERRIADDAGLFYEAAQ